MDIRQNLLKIKNNELLFGSLILLVLTNLGNVMSYIFQFVMARMLGPEDYGTLAVITSLIAIMGIPTLSIQTVVAKRVTILHIKKEFGKIKGLIDDLTKKLLIISLILYILFFVISIFLSRNLNIPFWILALTGTFIFGALIYSLYTGVLQGSKKFSGMGLSFFVNCLAKLLIGVILVVLGFKVYGAVLGFVLGIIVSIFAVFPFIKEISVAKSRPQKFNILSGANLSSFVAMLIFVLMYSVDVFFAKYVFEASIAGQYAVISLIGKIILFIVMAIGSVMFPINTERHLKKNKSNVVKKAYILSSIVCMLSLIVVYFFPEYIVKILFGIQYISLSSILPYIFLAFIFLSFLNLLILYHISIENFKRKNLIFLAIFFILEIIILLNTNNNVLEFSRAFMFSSGVSFLGGLVLFRKWKK